jgi:hypothetical protein
VEELAMFRTSPAHPLTPSPILPHAERIRALSDEVDRLRRCHDVADDRAQAFMLKLAEIQLNLAVQDKTLGKLDAAVNGNGRPGLATRVDAVERVTGGLVRSVWLLASTAVAAVVKVVLDRVH